MDYFWKRLSRWGDAWTGPTLPFAVYNVTLRQGRHIIRRKLFRRLRYRMQSRARKPILAITP